MANLIAAACDSLTSDCLDNLNGILLPDQAKATALGTPRGFISGLIPYLFTFGGLILLIMLMWGGLEMLTGASDPKAQEAGKTRMSNAIIGFILLFCSYWLAQLVQAIFGISIL